MANTENSKDPSSARLLERMGHRYGIDPDKLLQALLATAFRQKKDVVISIEQLIALLVIADQYTLNPFLKEIYAFPDKKNGIIPVVGVDGWSRIVNDHPQYDGEEFRYSPDMIAMPGTEIKCHSWIECVMYRKDRSRPTIIREYLDEVYRPPHEGTGERGEPYTINGPWQTHPKRFLRHKSFIQCGRIALGFTGIYDEDEAHRIIDMGNVVEVSASHSLPALEQSKIDPVVEELIERAKDMNNWSASNQYLMQRFKGREFAYASEKLKAAQAAHLRVQDVQSGPDTQAQDTPNTSAPPKGFDGVFEDQNLSGRDPIPVIAGDDDFSLSGGGNNGGF